jgi:hypothetical protein
VHAKIADDAITALKIATGAVGSDEIDTNAVTSVKIGSNAVTSAKISDDTIVNADISSSAAIAVSKLATGTAGQLLTMVSSTPTWLSNRSVIRTAVADVNYTVLTSDYVVAYTSLTATRTVSLPAAATAGGWSSVCH